DLVLQERRQQPGALRVTDENHAAPVAVVRDVVLPRVHDVAVDEIAVDLDGLSAEEGEKRRQRDLAIHWREDTTDRPQPRGLLPDDEELLHLPRRALLFP